jgi:outer membrane lipoprotein-sorting protein
MQKVESQVLTGKSVITSMGIEMPFVITMARPNMIRVESVFQDMKMIQTYDGEKAWMLAPMMGSSEPTELSGPELKMLISQSDMEGPLYNYKEKGNTVELVGEELIKDAPAYHLKITTSEGDVINQYIDKKSKMMVKVATTQTVGGAETEIENLIGNYKMVKGIAVAHSITSRMNGQTVTTVEITEIEFNKRVDPAIFGKPSL